jgi:PncC family amidohydrolase
MPSALADSAAALIASLSGAGLLLSCAESCTGGIVTAAVTDVPGSSAVLWGGVTAYSNECKSRILGVPPETIAEFGAVSREVARSMALGAIERSRGPRGERGADLALAITGIAGPEGGTPEKPVGLVWFGFRLSGRLDRRAIQEISFEESARFSGGRRAIREAAAAHAMTRAAALAMGRY